MRQLPVEEKKKGSPATSSEVTSRHGAKGTSPERLIVPLNASETKDAAALLASAFGSDPTFIYAFPDEVHRDKALCWLFERLVRCTISSGQVLTTASRGGVALWLGPERHSLSPWGLLRAGLGAFPLACGWSAFARFLRLAEQTRRLHARAVRGPHWYLFALGVRPSCQRQGIGKALLNYLLAQADASLLPCYLDTANPANLPYYAPYGFEVIGERRVATREETLTFWGMLRRPRQDRPQ